MKIRVVARLTLRDETSSRKSRGGQLTHSVLLPAENLTLRTSGHLATATTLVRLLLLLRLDREQRFRWRTVPHLRKPTLQPFREQATGKKLSSLCCWWAQSRYNYRQHSARRWRHIVRPWISRHNVADQYVFDEGEEKHQHRPPCSEPRSADIPERRPASSHGGAPNCQLEVGERGTRGRVRSGAGSGRLGGDSRYDDRIAWPVSGWRADMAANKAERVWNRVLRPRVLCLSPWHFGDRASIRRVRRPHAVCRAGHLAGSSTNCVPWDFSRQFWQHAFPSIKRGSAAVESISRATTYNSTAAAQRYSAG